VSVPSGMKKAEVKKKNDELGGGDPKRKKSISSGGDKKLKPESMVQDQSSRFLATSPPSTVIAKVLTGRIALVKNNGVQRGSHMWENEAGSIRGGEEGVV